MAWVRFTGDYNFRPTYAVTIAYKAGMTMNVVTPCAVQAIAKGKAVRMTRSSKYEEPVEATNVEVDECQVQDPSATYSTSSKNPMAPMDMEEPSPERDRSQQSSNAQPV